jgi:hypothetical protein
MSDEFDFKKFISCVTFTATENLKKELEKSWILSVNANRIPLEACIYPAAIDCPSKAYAEKLLQDKEKVEEILPDKEKVEIDVVEEKAFGKLSYHCKPVIREGPILHIIGEVGFTVAEYFSGDPTFKHQRKTDIVTVRHAYDWSIIDPDLNESNQPLCDYISLETERELVQYHNIAIAQQLPYYIHEKNQVLVRLARLDPLPHEIVSGSCIRKFETLRWGAYSFLLNNTNINHLKWTKFLEIRGLKKEEVTIPFPFVELTCFKSCDHIWSVV